MNGGLLDGHRMVVTIHPMPYWMRSGMLHHAKVEIKGEMVPVDIAATVLAHNEKSDT